MIDSHTHLASCEQPGEELVAAARAAGVHRILDVGLDADSSSLAVAAAEAFPEVFAAVGHHPTAAGRFDDAADERLATLAAQKPCVAVGETGLDYFRERATKAEQERAFHAQIDLARAVAKPLIIHSRAADDDTIATLSQRAEGLDVVLHCFSMYDRVDECAEHERWWFSFAGNVTYPKNAELAAAAARVPGDRLLVETDAPYLTPQAVRKHRNQPAFVEHTARFVADVRGVAYEELEVLVDANAARLFGW